MELRTTRELWRSARMEQATPDKADTAAKAQAKAQTPQPKEPSDKFSLSRQALAYVEEQSRQIWERQEGQGKRDGAIQGWLDAMETQKEQLDSMEEKLDMMNKCQKIAAAIMRGDRVPPEDLRYLMEHDKEGYKMALALRRPKKDPEDVKSVLDEEDKNGETSQGSGGGEAPTVEGAGGAEGGGPGAGTTG